MSSYGWTPDLPDLRDRSVEGAEHLGKFQPPSYIDMRPKCPPVYDQGQLGSCTANAIAAAIQFERRRQKLLQDFVPSRLFIYYNERLEEGTVDSDSGAMIRDGIKAVAKFGDCPEAEWGYDIAKFKEQPVPVCYADALKYRAVDYWRVPRSMLQVRGCLAAGFPIVFGFSVYDSFESLAVAHTGIVPMPDPAHDSMVGGHAVLAVGYDDSRQMLIVRNSWGDAWGDAGYFYLPYEYILNADLSDDFWTIKLEIPT
jgi:C1A family cysteine protease